MPTNKTELVHGIDGKAYAVELVDTGTTDEFGNAIYKRAVDVELTVADEVTVDVGTPITGQALEAGGVGLSGWLSSIRKKLTDSFSAGVALIAGEAHIGEVGGKVISKSVTFLRPHTTTQYTAKDCLGVDVPITGGTQATPTVMTAVAHGCADGDPVTISGVVGDTNANGSNYAKRTGYTADTLALYSDKALTTPIVGNAGWSSGGDLARCFRLKDIFRKAGGDGYVMKVRLGFDSATALLGDYLRVHFYRRPVAAVLDNAAYALSWAKMPYRLGFIDMPPLALEAAGGDMIYALACPNGLPGLSGSNNIGLHVFNDEVIPGTDLYFMIEDLSTGTPANDEPALVEVDVDNN